MAPLNNQIPKELAGDAWVRQRQLQELERTMRLAEIRCIPFDELVNRVEHIWEDKAPNEILYRVCKEPFSQNEILALVESARRLAGSADQLPQPHRSVTLKALKRILARLPAESVAPIVEPWLRHKHKFRRHIAYRVFRGAGVPPEFGPKLLAAFQHSADQECLELIARHPRAVASSDLDLLINSIGERYWRMRVIQSLLSLSDERAVSLASKHPYEFVWAVGRQKDAGFLPNMRALLETESDDLDFLSIYVWVLGQIGATKELDRVRKLMCSMAADERAA